MDWLYIVCSLLAVIFVTALLVLWKSDCDLSLAWNLWFGKAPEALAGKVVWITGASSGIGEALACTLASAGCRLVLSARREQRLNQTKTKCLAKSKLKSEDILVLPLDLLEFNTHVGATETVIKYFKKIDILVNNAGRSQRCMFDRTPIEVDKQLFDVDVFATVSLTKAVIPHMVARCQGHIVVTSSVSGKLGAPGQASYSGAKHALQGYFDALRIEAYRKNICVTLVCPGPIFSEALVHAFTDTPNKVLGIEMHDGMKRMTSARCAHLMAVSMANKLDEAWISQQPELIYCYLFQYMPYIAKKLAVRLGQDRANKVRHGTIDLRGK